MGQCPIERRLNIKTERKKNSYTPYKKTEIVNHTGKARNSNIGKEKKTVKE